MQSPISIAESFSDLDLHDATFVSMKVLPAQSRGNTTGSIVEMTILQRSEQKKRVLQFTGCTNLRVGIDFDVLAHNFPPNTLEVDAHNNASQLRNLLQLQTRDWGVRYSTNMSTPLDRKLEEINELICFRAQLCGGVVEIVARQYHVQDVEK